QFIFEASLAVPGWDKKVWHSTATAHFFNEE
ncbi:MAG: hypothetical protein ACI81T_003311, partial [Bacteroidia bacterium]